jgi:hypothetical protein
VLEYTVAKGVANGSTDGQGDLSETRGCVVTHRAGACCTSDPRRP